MSQLSFLPPVRLARQETTTSTWGLPPPNAAARIESRLVTSPNTTLAPANSCGGGRHNPTLMAMLAAALPCPLLSAEDAGWRGDSIEAEAFALLAVRRWRGLAISFPGTTGVPDAMTGGEICAV